MSKIEFEPIENHPDSYDIFFNDDLVAMIEANHKDGRVFRWIFSMTSDHNEFYGQKNSTLFYQTYAIQTNDLEDVKKWVSQQLSPLRPATNEIEFTDQPQNDRNGVPTVKVVYNGDDYGRLKFDQSKNTWVLWRLSLDDDHGTILDSDLKTSETKARKDIEAFDY